MNIDIKFVREQFPALSREWVFFDNAGGGQILDAVVKRINEYYLTSNVQMGASYGISTLAKERLQDARRTMATLINAEHGEEVVMGSSSTMLLKLLSFSFSKLLEPGDEIIISNSEHASNIGPWLDLERHGVKIKFWNINPQTLRLETADLLQLMTKRTRLVTVTHVSNILGTINPIEKITEVVHEHGALVCVDGVAYAPHRLIDVQALDVDFYVFSLYKVFGPHHAVMYGKRSQLLNLPGINLSFVKEDDIPYKFEPGHANYELSYGAMGIMDYLDEFSEVHGYATSDALRTRLSTAFEIIAHHEEILAERLLEYLNSQPRVNVIGETSSSKDVRVPTISFVVEGMSSAQIPLVTDKHKIGLRYGDFYSRRILQDLDLQKNDGVVRVSMVHYNTVDEVDRLTEVLATIL